MIVSSSVITTLRGLRLSLLFVAGFAGCNHNNPDRVVVDYVYLEERETHLSFTEDGLLLEEFDVNKDGVIDNRAYSQPLDRFGEPLESLEGYTPSTLPRSRMVRREIDLNHDGLVDLVKHYDFKGQILREEVDSDFSGVVDRITHFSNGFVARRELDVDENGIFEERRFYIRGKIFRVEFDENQDGQTEYWQFYTDGVLTRAGKDIDGDRVIDEWLQETDLATLREMERRRGIDSDD